MNTISVSTFLQYILYNQVLLLNCKNNFILFFKNIFIKLSYCMLISNVLCISDCLLKTAMQ